jgi:peptidoglycan/xylan/chitin deacetylase (PgdA/CDA1 family)
MRLDWLIPQIKGIPVLMYHRVWPGLQDRITVTPEQLRDHFAFLKSEGYTAISLQEFHSISSGQSPLREKIFLLTFDDGYENNLTYVYPLLQELKWKATFFIIGDSLEGNISQDDPLNKKITVEQLKGLDSNIVQLAMHGFHHEHFGKLNLEEMKSVMINSLNAFQSHGIEVVPSLAYPYGGRPKDQQLFKDFKDWMKENGIISAFRIGNQVSKVPADDMYEIKRIDIRGEDGIKELGIKLKKGKLRPF